MADDPRRSGPDQRRSQRLRPSRRSATAAFDLSAHSSRWPARGALVALALAISLGGAQSVAAAEARAGKPVMGTVLQVSVEADDEATARLLADRAVTVAQRWDDILTTWRPEGELARLNAAAGRGPFAASGELRSALARMRRLASSTAGAFNPAAGALVDLWRKPTAPRTIGPAPAFAEAVRVDRDGVRLVAGVRLDAGGIGKGIALDVIARVLRAGGAGSLWLDFGGSTQVNWSQGRRPRRLLLAGVGQGSSHGALELGDAALSTSRSTAAGSEAGPIVDPRTGELVPPGRLATVIARDATTADAWSTALVVLGRDGLERARTVGIEYLYEDSEGVVESSGFRSGRPGR